MEKEKKNRKSLEWHQSIRNNCEKKRKNYTIWRDVNNPIWVGIVPFK